MKRRLLLIEPDTILAEAYMEVLSAKGWDVYLAGGAGQAVDWVNKKTFDLIILEPQLPEHDGMELLHELRSYSDTSRVPVVILSTNSQYAQLNTSPAKDLFGIQSFLYKQRMPLSKIAESV